MRGGHFEWEIKIMGYECLVYFVLRLLFEASIKHQACCVAAKQRFGVCYPIRASYKRCCGIHRRVMIFLRRIRLDLDAMASTKGVESTTMDVE